MLDLKPRASPDDNKSSCVNICTDAHFRSI